MKRETYKNGNLITVEDLPDPPKPSEEEQIATWLAENKFAAALIRALNKPTTDPGHLPPNAALSQADLVAKIKANLA